MADAKQITFDYADWDNRRDIALLGPGSQAGYATLNGALKIGKAPTVRQGRRSPHIGPLIDGVIGTLAGALEWCREYGLGPEDVRSRVTAYMANNRSSPRQVSLLASASAVTPIADPDGVYERVPAGVREAFVGKEPRW
jgi:hypothetical protein